MQMLVRQTFGVVRRYLKYFFLRFDIWLITFVGLIIAYSSSFLGAFLLLFLGLKDFMGEKLGTVDTGFWLLPQITAGEAVNAGIALLGVSAIASLAAVFFAVRTAAGFGASLVMKFQSNWDSIADSDKKAILNTAAFATKYARLVLVSLMPFSVFALGVAYLLSYNILLGIAVFILGFGALFVFIPVSMISRRVTSHEFDPAISKAELKASQPKLIKFLFARLDMFVSRRSISAANLLILFFVIAVAFSIFGPERIVSLFNEQSVVVILLARASLLSLTRMTLCLRMANKKMDSMKNVIRILRSGKIPQEVNSSAGFDDDDD